MGSVPVGKQYGQGLVTRVPAIFTEAADYTGAAQPPPSGRKPPKQLTSPPLDEDDIKFILVGIVSGIPQIQRYIVDNYCLSDMEFVFLTAAVRGRDNVYYMYRTATTMLQYKVMIRDIILNPTKACIVVDLKVRPRGLPVTYRTFPCCVVMHFATDPADGKTKVALQHDYHTFFMCYWMGGLWAVQLVQAVLLPLGGWVMVAQGKASEYLRIHGRWLWQQFVQPLTSGAEHADEPAGIPVSPHFLAAASSVRDALSSGQTQEQLDECVRQATAEVGLDMVDEEDRSAWESWGWMGWVIRTVGGCIGLSIGYTLLVLSFALNFFKPVP